jgi:hypothetical protein
MVKSTVQSQERQRGHVGQNLTRHSTGARVSRSLIVELAIAGLNPRPVNSALDSCCMVKLKGTC